jgi:hypothetical protein
MKRESVTISSLGTKLRQVTTVQEQVQCWVALEFLRATCLDSSGQEAQRGAPRARFWPQLICGVWTLHCPPIESPTRLFDTDLQVLRLTNQCAARTHVACGPLINAVRDRPARCVSWSLVFVGGSSSSSWVVVFRPRRLPVYHTS